MQAVQECRPGAVTGCWREGLIQRCEIEPLRASPLIPPSACLSARAKRGKEDGEPTLDQSSTAPINRGPAALRFDIERPAQGSSLVYFCLKGLSAPWRRRTESIIGLPGRAI